MTDDNVNDNGSPEKEESKVRAKIITIRNVGPRWLVEFEGVVTRRDIHRINRILTVEFTRAQRRYSLERKKALLTSKSKESPNAIC